MVLSLLALLVQKVQILTLQSLPRAQQQPQKSGALFEKGGDGKGGGLSRSEGGLPVPSSGAPKSDAPGATRVVDSWREKVDFALLTRNTCARARTHSVYWLCWYNSSNTDAKSTNTGGARWTLRCSQTQCWRSRRYSQCTCCTDTKVQILTLVYLLYWYTRTNTDAAHRLQGSTTVPPNAAKLLDGAFWRELERFKDAAGLTHIEQRAKGLERVVEQVFF